MSTTVLVMLVAGLGLLVLGAELLVRGASRLALRLGISPLVIGLTVVAFGTSAPELAVSVKAGLAGQADIALGNVVGSNIANILLILGLSAAITPLVVSRQLLRLDVPLLLAASVLLLVMALDGHVGRLDGLLLFTGILVYTVYAIRQSRRETASLAAADLPAPGPAGASLLMSVGAVAAGLAMLVLGADWLVEGATVAARWLGVSDLVIGLTVVAVGTSLPELATSVVAALRGERDIAVGNVIGSGLFNILSIVGIAALVTPAGLPVAPSLVSFDMPVMIVATLACLPIFATGHLIARWEGGLFIAYYAAYVLYLALAASQHDALEAFSTAMLGFVVPLTGVTLVVLWVRQPRAAASG